MEVQMEMYNPPHPGEILKEDYLVPLELSITEAASALGVAGRAGCGESLR